MSITKTPTSMIDPTGATAGDVLTYNNSTNSWGASSLSAQGFSASLSSNGYQKLPSGVIIQWGTSDIGYNESSYLITFPIPYPNAAFNVTAVGGYGAAVNGSIGLSVISLSSNGFHILGDPSNQHVTSAPLYWQSIGY
jgi:hypothetical protein